LVQNGPKKSGRGGQANADEFRQNAEKATGRARQSKKEKQALILAGLPAPGRANWLPNELGGKKPGAPDWAGETGSPDEP
jgi:hypothetical protein